MVALFIALRKFTITDKILWLLCSVILGVTKLKNDKIMPWRIKLSQYCYDIVYRPGKFNVVSEVLSRAYCAAATVNALHRIHASLCHPGITRIYHYIQRRNFPYSLDDIKTMTSACAICCEIN